VSFLLGRAYYNYVALLSQMLADWELDKYLIPGMGQVLFVLFEEDCLPMKEVARRVELAASTLSGMVRRMESAGLVRRVQNDQDGRSVLLEMTALARSLEPRCQELTSRLEEDICAGFSPAERAALGRLLKRLTANLRGALKRKPGSQDQEQ
jgi:MarR family transcriptional regulator, organic hydroperoxide resistance regulator